jgi:hypothetical protein
MASLGLIWAVFCFAQLFNPYLQRLEDGAPSDATSTHAENSDTAKGSTRP